MYKEQTVNIYYRQIDKNVKAGNKPELLNFVDIKR